MSSLAASPIAIRPFDDHLDALIEKEVRGAQLPLALTRFAEMFNTSRPTQAMRAATDELLAKYASVFGDSVSLPIKVEGLCRMSKVQLAGIRPAARPSTAYSSDDHTPRLGHTGKTYFEGSRASIRIPPHVDYATARISVAHELGHVLVHLRGNGFDEATVRLPSSPEEECIAEYGARLLLMPSKVWQGMPQRTNLAEEAVIRSSIARVTIHSAVARLGDPDLGNTDIKGAILWRLNPEVPSYSPVHERLTPHWHLCRGAFVPIKRSKARAGSVSAKAAERQTVAADSRVEDVRVGTFIGVFTVDVLAWGSVADGTRLVLATFRQVDSSR
jgi:hypothetical protein